MTLDFANVSGITNFPYYLQMQSIADGYWVPPTTTGSAIYSSGGVLGLAADAIVDNTHMYVNVGRGLKFKSYTTTADLNRLFNFTFDTKGAAGDLVGFTHTIWSTAGATIMSLTPAGILGIGDAYGASISAASGKMTLGGTGNTNNENLTLDFDCGRY